MRFLDSPRAGLIIRAPFDWNLIQENENENEHNL